MVEAIKDTKDQLLDKMQQTIDEKGIERVDVTEMGKLADQVKDLAEAEKACWEAEYYRAVTEAMEDGSMGYDDGMGYERGGQGMGRGGRGYARGGSGYERGGRGYRRGYERGGQGYEQGGRGYRRGYRGQPRDSQGRYTSRRGYRGMESYGHDDMMQDVKDMLMSADPQEKEQLKMQLRQMADM